MKFFISNSSLSISYLFSLFSHVNDIVVQLTYLSRNWEAASLAKSVSNNPEEAKRVFLFISYRLQSLQSLCSLWDSTSSPLPPILLPVSSPASGKCFRKTSGISNCVENQDHMCASHTHIQYVHTRMHIQTHTQAHVCTRSMLFRLLFRWSLAHNVFILSNVSKIQTENHSGISGNLENVSFQNPLLQDCWRGVTWSVSHVVKHSETEQNDCSGLCRTF